MSFDGKTIWITGASSGIGAALAREAAARGASLVLSGRDEARLAEVAADCDTRVDVEPFDVRDEDAMRAAVERVGAPDLFVANAGISQRSRAARTEMRVYREIVEIDLLAQIAHVQALLPGMIARAEAGEPGGLVFISSIAGKVGVPMRTAYCAAKHGLVGYADALRAELSQTGIGVHVVAPGSVATDVSRNALTGEGGAARNLGRVRSTRASRPPRPPPRSSTPSPPASAKSSSRAGWRRRSAKRAARPTRCSIKWRRWSRRATWKSWRGKGDGTETRRAGERDRTRYRGYRPGRWGRRRVLIFLHGFPESHRTWRHQIAHFRDRYRCIAPDQRGYRGSSKFREVEAYTPDKLIGDVFLLAAELEVKEFTVVGHDWGGAIAWGVALTGQATGRVTRAVIANAPHPAIFQRLLYTNEQQRRSSQYIRGFRDPANDPLIREQGLTGILCRRFAGTGPTRWNPRNAPRCWRTGRIATPPSRCSTGTAPARSSCPTWTRPSRCRATGRPRRCRT